MNLLFFASIDFYARPNPSFHLMTAMIEDLLAAGHSVYFVGKANRGLDRHVPEQILSHPHFHCRLVPFSPPAKSNFPMRYLTGITYALKARKHIREFAPKCDASFLQSTATLLYNALVARGPMRGKKMVMNVQDMFPGSSIASGVMPRKWMQKIFYRLQKAAYRRSDLVVGISEDMRHKLVEQGVPREKTRVVLNWFDDKTVHAVGWEENRFVRKYSMDPGRFYVQYAGTMGYVFDYRMVLEVARRLKEYPDIEFQMIGQGSQKEAFVAEAEKEGLTNIRFMPLEPQEMVSDVYSACSVCLIPLKHGIIGNSVPSKAGLLMECARPIVTSADRDSDYVREINDNGIGIACADDDPDGVAQALLSLYRDRAKGEEMGRRGHQYGHVRYSRSHNMGKYLDIFSE